MSPALFSLSLLIAIYFVVLGMALPDPYKKVMLYASVTVFLTAFVLAIATISRGG